MTSRFFLDVHGRAHPVDRIRKIGTLQKVLRMNAGAYKANDVHPVYMEDYREGWPVAISPAEYDSLVYG